MPERLLPHRYTMKVCTPRSATRGLAKLAAITHRKAGDAARAGATPATQPGSVPTGSMKAFAVYVKRLLAKGKKTSGVVTRFSLQKAQNAGGIAYSQAQFAVARLLTEEELPYIAAMAEQVKAFATCVGYEVEAVSAEAVDPETGEILPPLA